MSSCFCPNAVNLFVGLLIGNLNCASIAANIDDHYDGVFGGGFILVSFDGVIPGGWQSGGVGF